MHNLKVNQVPKFKCKACQDTGIIGIDEIDRNNGKVVFPSKATSCGCFKGKEICVKLGLRYFREALEEPWNELSWQSKMNMGIE